MAQHIDPEQWNTVFSAAELTHAREVALVLDARGLPNRLERHGPRWMVCVPEHCFDAAKAEVLAWLEENARPAGRERSLRVLGSGWPGVVAWVVILGFAAFAAPRRLFGFDWYALGNADAAAIVAGEYWRTVTALMLHSDTAHLLGNAVFGSFFGYYVGRYLGDGFGWSMILLGGVLGNALNAWVQSPLHRSVGASTAVFAALGILTAFRWKRGFEPNTPWRIRFAPLYAGLALLAFTGTAGETTDLGAHMFGFVCGALLGLFAARFLERIGTTAQYWFAGISCGSCLMAWQLAFGS